MVDQPRIELLQAEAAEDDESFLRVLVDNVSVKYITVEQGLYSVENLCFGPTLPSVLPTFPPGDWNDGLVARNPDDGRPHFSRACLTQFPGVQNIWHDTRVEYTDVTVCQKLRTGIYEVKCPLFDDTIVAKFARFDWEIQYMENETTAYQWIDGNGIGPQFLGHLTENGRVIGFLLERIHGARHAAAEDFGLCEEVLSRLNGLGIRHGDTKRFNFLVHDSKAILIDFDTAQRCDDPDMLLQELQGLTARLKDSSSRGGGGIL